jgi:hypothetical protein
MPQTRERRADMADGLVNHQPFPIYHYSFEQARLYAAVMALRNRRRAARPTIPVTTSTIDAGSGMLELTGGVCAVLGDCFEEL